jgi:tetratricopeptide (TPR) repeat protein
MRCKRLALALLFAVYAASAFGQGTSAEQQIQAGQKAAAQGQHAEAARLFALAVQEAEKSSKDRERLGASLTGLGLAYSAQRRFAEAEPILQRAVTVKENVLGPDHPDFARALLDLGTLYRLKNEHAKAEPPIRRAVAILEKALGPEHPEVAGNLTNLGGRLRDQGKFAEAEPILKRALTIREKILPRNHPDVVRSMLGLANLYADQKKYVEAEPIFQRCVTVLDTIKAYGTGYPNLPDTLRLYANVLRNTGRTAEAEATEARARALRPQ